MRAFDAGYTISRRVLILDKVEKQRTLEIPAGSDRHSKLCSINSDGMIMKSGIPVLISFAGLSEVNRKQTANFTDFIAYAGSSNDPIKAFMDGKVTSAAKAVFKGFGSRAGQCERDTRRGGKTGPRSFK